MAGPQDQRSDAPESRPPPRRSRAWRFGLLALALLLLLPVLLVAGAVTALWQGLHTETGTRWWLQQAVTRVPGLQIDEPSGPLLGADAAFSIRRLVVVAGRTTVRVDALSTRGLQVSQLQLSPPYARVTAQQLAAQRVAVDSAPSPEPTPPAKPPVDLRLPVTARVDAVRIDELQLPGLNPPLQALAAQIDVGATHRLDGLSLRWNGLRASGQAQIGAAAPLDLVAQIGIQTEGPVASATPPGAASAPVPAAPAPAPAAAGASATFTVPPWARDVSLALQAKGPLTRLDARAELTMQAQKLDAKAQVAPFEPMPLSQLDASFSQLDLARLLAPFDVDAAPTTALTGQVGVQLSREQPLQIRAQIANEQPGRWDRKRAPLRSLDLLARGEGGATGQWQIERARLELAADEKTPAGVIKTSGRYDAGRANATFQFDSVMLQGLDERAPPLLLNGPLALAFTPPKAAGPAPAAAASAPADFGMLAVDARLAGKLTQSRGKALPPALRDSVQLALKGQFAADQLNIETLNAQAGKAQLEGKAQARRAGKLWQADADLKFASFDPTLWVPGEPGASWRRGPNVLNGVAQLSAKLPVVEPAEPQPGKARGKPARAGGAPAWLAQLEGQLKAELKDSALAGQALTLALEAQADGRGLLAAKLNAEAANNRANVDLKLRSDPATAGNGSSDQNLQLDIDAPALASLSGVMQALGAAPLAGKLRATARAEGPLGAWVFGSATQAALTTRGNLAIDDFKTGGVQLDAAKGDWDLTLPGLAGPGPGSDSPRATGKGGSSAPPTNAVQTASARAAVRTQFDITRLQVPGLLVPSAALQLDGSLAEHRASVNALLRAVPAAAPPGSAAAAAAASTKTGASTSGASGASGASSAPGLNAAPGATEAREPAPLSLQTRLSGAWTPGAGSSPSTWRGRIQELALRPTGNAARTATNGNGTGNGPKAVNGAASAPTEAASAPGGTPAPGADPLALILARDVDVELAQDPQNLRANVSPGQATILGAVLRWTRVRWERSGEAEPRLDLQAEVEPFQVAPLLQRLQPDFGWQGDLRLGAKAEIRSEPAVTARVEVARTGGDLQVQELDSLLKLGLRELRLDLNAQDGLWRMTQVVDGETLGRLAGAQTVRTDAQKMWPPPDAPVEGALRLQVEQLSTWGAWVPAGWRLGGAVDGVLRLGGKFGGPDLIGELSGQQLAVRNALEGVALSDGTLDARFEGGTARLNTLRFKAGEGSLSATGDARLGTEPTASLKLVAERATVLGRVDRRVVISGQTAIQVEANAVKIDGAIKADEGLIDISSGDAPSLGDDVTVRRRGEPGRPADTAPAKPPRDVDLKLAIDMGDNFRLRGRGIDTRLEGDLKITTPNGKLIAYGEIRTERGTYEAYGQKLEIERGVITFVGDIGNPRLDISAIRANTDTRVGVNIGGSVVTPRIRLFSDPELPTTEKLALLVTGRNVDSLGGNESLLLQRAAMALLAGEGGSSTSGFDAAKLFKLDELSVRQSDGAVRETVVALGKQISERVYVGYERGLNSTAGNLQLIYRIAKRFTLRAQSGEDPAVDLIWVFRWN